jgi:hypothetical protein
VASYEEMSIKIQNNRKVGTRMKGENNALSSIELRVKVKANYKKKILSNS